MERLTPLANKLGTTTEYLWAVLMKQALFAGIADLILWIGVIIAIVIILKWGKYYRINYEKLYKADNYSEILHGFGLLIFTIIVTIFLIIAVVNLQTMFAAFFNPEYWALHEILSQLCR